MVLIDRDGDEIVIKAADIEGRYSPDEAAALASDLEAKAEEIVGPVDPGPTEIGWGIDKTVDGEGGADACPSCGTELNGSEQFCPQCGEDLATAAAGVGIEETRVVTLTVGDKREQLLPEQALDLSVDLEAQVEQMR
ncbi:zinc ribbon domain-containing protein [Halosimplex halophilum]|uniref:zinc ribbon domain-containing protein n=1 Tax=Halosimplex halophilum TaxID=2559572 RepID=UPI00107F407F|nr:zinc ribbon domain-containing protein [Halosimplex halophilum]